MENKVQMPVLLYSIDLRLYRNAVPVVLTDLNKCAKLFEGHSTQILGDTSVEEESAELLSPYLSEGTRRAGHVGHFLFLMECICCSMYPVL